VLSFRGLDNAGYYRLDERGGHLDTSGTGNALDASRPVVQRLVLDSLAHWVGEYGVDGFRFDLAASLGRDADGGFRSDHPLLTAIAADERLAGAKLIAEPWDVGPGGWRTGEFPAGWSEWNDTFRDRVRSFWVEDVGRARRTGVHPAGVGPFTTAVAGSSDRFSDDRGPLASVNYVTAHDGFTLHDLVSYNVKHNLLNGELDRDGSSDNRSYNFGAEGPCDDERILSARRLAMRNLLGSLLLASGVPMLTAGDEYARTQHGNNNPYNQDNETSWFDWEPDERQRALAEHVARLLEIRRSHPALRPLAYNHNGDLLRGATSLRWFDALGGAMQGHAWDSPATRTVQYLARAGVPRPGGPRTPGGVRADAAAAGPGPVEDGAEVDAVLVVVHGSEFPTLLRLPVVEGIAGYALLWDSAAETVGRIWDDPAACEPPAGATLRMPGPSMRLYRAVPETPAVRAPD
ncbi:MAG: glycogen debranching enzyme, partial [Pseudoclavibacter sp.]|nr:glycogen debranching enzyme [Pseudoclavibacter sp.]